MSSWVEFNSTSFWPRHKADWTIKHFLMCYEMTDKRLICALLACGIRARCWTRSCRRWPRCWTRRQMNLRAPQETRYSLTPSLIYWSRSKHPPLLSKLWAILFFLISPFILSRFLLSRTRLYDAGYQFRFFLFSSWWHSARLLYARQEMSCWWMKAHSSFDSPSLHEGAVALAHPLWKFGSFFWIVDSLDSRLL